MTKEVLTFIFNFQQPQFLSSGWMADVLVLEAHKCSNSVCIAYYGEFPPLNLEIISLFLGTQQPCFETEL